MTFLAYIFPKLWTRKTWLDRCLKSTVCDDPSTGQNTDSVSMPVSLPYSKVTVKVIELEKATLSDMQSIKSFC